MRKLWKLTGEGEGEEMTARNRTGQPVPSTQSPPLLGVLASERGVRCTLKLFSCQWSRSGRDTGALHSAILAIDHQVETLGRVSAL